LKNKKVDVFGTQCSYVVDIQPAKSQQCSSASSLNDVIMQCRYVSIPYRRASLNTRTTVSYKQIYASVLPNNEFYKIILPRW